MKNRIPLDSCVFRACGADAAILFWPHAGTVPDGLIIHADGKPVRLRHMTFFGRSGADEHLAVVAFDGAVFSYSLIELSDASGHLLLAFSPDKTADINFDPAELADFFPQAEVKIRFMRFWTEVGFGIHALPFIRKSVLKMARKLSSSVPQILPDAIFRTNDGTLLVLSTWHGGRQQPDAGLILFKDGFTRLSGHPEAKRLSDGLMLLSVVSADPTDTSATATGLYYFSRSECVADRSLHCYQSTLA